MELLSIGALLLAVVLSLDLLAVSFAYGSEKIKIPFKSNIIITVIGSTVLALSVYLGNFISLILPYTITDIIGSSILFILGIIKIFDSVIKGYIRKNGKISKNMNFSIFSLKFAINVYADPKKADIDNSRIISSNEAIIVAFAVALDAVALGVGAALIEISFIQLIMFSLIFDVLAVLIGSFLGRSLAQKSPINLSWLGGIILIILSFL